MNQLITSIQTAQSNFEADLGENLAPQYSFLLFFGSVDRVFSRGLIWNVYVLKKLVNVIPKSLKNKISCYIGYICYRTCTYIHP